jgi:hypothetical protein
MVAKRGFRVYALYEGNKCLFVGKATCSPSQFLNRYKYITTTTKTLPITQYLTTHPESLELVTVKQLGEFKKVYTALQAKKDFLFDLQPLYNA